jgi:FkbH-like protein/FkbM family methyltransferase
MVVLPGSFYVDLALRVERELAQRLPGLVRNITFHSPVILSAEDSVIEVEAYDRGAGKVAYSFYEGAADDDRPSRAGRRPVAELEIVRGSLPSQQASPGAMSAEAFKAQPHTAIGAEAFYESLRDNGNQYGPGFQNVRAIWRAGDQCLGQLSFARRLSEDDTYCLHPSLLDSVTQLLAPFTAESGKTFILRSIGRIEVATADLPDALWGHAVQLRGSGGDGNALIGDVRVFDESGRTCLALSEVAFTLLERVESTADAPATRLTVASNFTAEPLEDSLKFWGDHFGIRLDIEFAPYNQVFQQLLDAGSALHRNSGGINAIVLSLEEWATKNRAALPVLSKERADQCFGARARHVLPNGAEIAHLNRYETEYLYKEIFEDQSYLRHGVRLRDGDTVVDIGANIGLFSLFVLSRCANPTIYACEPAPVVHDLLKSNGAAYGSGVHALNVGVSDRRRTATFTFYEKSSVFSGLHSNEAEDRAAIQAVVRNLLRNASVEADEYVEELTADRLRHSTCEVQLVSLSDIIRENCIERIDLLKIDAEKSELDILEGIDERDWPKIRQIVIEIHDRTGEAVSRVRRLLGDKGFRCAVDQESLLENAGLFNVYAIRNHDGDEFVASTSGEAAKAPARLGTADLARTVEEFRVALRAFANQTAAPLLLCICPASPAANDDPELLAALNEAERSLGTEAGSLPGVHMVTAASVLRSYPLNDYYDSLAHRVGHVPYTPEGYAAIGSALFRTLFGLKKSPAKVIVLDCDNTLWKGVCGEDGAAGIEVTPPFRALQEFMIGQVNAGMLLCLCSKNNESDVLAVFNQRADMPLKREHLVSWRINWNSKSENIRSLADELDLGLDSFIFLDDNPVECADVRIRCPEVMTLQLPADGASFGPYLQHLWAFDHRRATAEDRTRTRMYQENRERHRYREQAFSLKDFLQGLQLRVDVAEATPDQLERVSQLTLRTNQFNFTAIRRTPGEIRELLERGRAKCLAVRVTDRFGDYGLVGVLIYETHADRYRVDSFLLSCRVLGRGVEHELVSRLAQQALAEGKGLIEFNYVPTAKNAPAREFMTSLGGADPGAESNSWLFATERLARTQYDPEANQAAGKPPNSDSVALVRQPSTAFAVAGLSERLQHIGEHLCDVDRLARAIEQHRLGSQAQAAVPDLTQGSSLETALAGIWRRVLGNRRIGLDDNFFEAGGTSLRAVQLVAMVKRELKRTLSIVSVFECPTVKLLSARLSGTEHINQGPPGAGAAALRGQQRRHHAIRRKTAPSKTVDSGHENH